MPDKHECSVPLSRRAFLGASAGLGAACLAAGAGRAGAAGSKPPNVLFIMADQYRGDCLGVDGHPCIHTPNLDRIAREGAHFSAAYTCTPSCTPARSALLSGLGPWRNGMLGYGRVAEKYPVEFPQAMRDAGYYTTGIGKMHWYPQRSTHGFHKTILDESGRSETPGFVSDYRCWFASMAPTKDPDATGIGWNDYRSGTYELPEELHPTRWTGDVACNFLQDYSREAPFFLKVSFARPHSPYDPPKRWIDFYADKPIPEAHVGGWASRYAKRSGDHHHIWHGDLGKEQVRKSRQGYYGNISFIDEQVGRMLDVLEKRGELDNTLIIFTADHGDMVGDHHMWRKTYAYEGSARIPMVMRWPSSIQGKRGVTLPQPVELRDMLPTCLDAAGQPRDYDFDGASMLALVRGNTGDWRGYIDLEHDTCYGKRNHWNALTDGRMKYIFHAFDGAEQLFDMEKDPGEERDVASDPAYADALAVWRGRMVAHLQERGTGWVRDGKLVPRPERMLYSPNFPGHAKA